MKTAKRLILVPTRVRDNFEEHTTRTAVDISPTSPTTKWVMLTSLTTIRRIVEEKVDVNELIVSHPTMVIMETAIATTAMTATTMTPAIQLEF